MVVGFEWPFSKFYFPLFFSPNKRFLKSAFFNAFSATNSPLFDPQSELSLYEEISFLFLFLLSLFSSIFCFLFFSFLSLTDSLDELELSFFFSELLLDDSLLDDFSFFYFLSFFFLLDLLSIVFENLEFFNNFYSSLSSLEL